MESARSGAKDREGLLSSSSEAEALEKHGRHWHEARIASSQDGLSMACRGGVRERFVLGNQIA